MMIDVGSAAARRPQDRPRSRRTRQTQSGDAVGFPGRRIRRRSFQFLLVRKTNTGFPFSTMPYVILLSQYRGALRGLQVRHPHPEDRQLLQSLHVN